MIRPKSKLPFRLSVLTSDNTVINREFITSDGKLIITPSSKDAEFIVHACNNYQKLVNKIKFLDKLLEERVEMDSSTQTQSAYLIIKENLKAKELLAELKET